MHCRAMPTAQRQAESHDEWDIPYARSNEMGRDHRASRIGREDFVEWRNRGNARKHYGWQSLGHPRGKLPPLKMSRRMGRVRSLEGKHG